MKLVSGVFVSPQVSVRGSICVWRRTKWKTKPATKSATPPLPNPRPRCPTPPEPPAGQRSPVNQSPAGKKTVSTCFCFEHFVLSWFLFVFIV